MQRLVTGKANFQGGIWETGFRLFFSFFLLFQCNNSDAAAVSEEKLRQISESRYWHLLLHYKKFWLWSGVDSEADGQTFFLHPDGKQDPYQELKANLEAFRGSKKIKIGEVTEHPQCIFPERYRYLKRELKVKIQPRSCPRFEDWKRKFRPQSATLIFASSYLNNPASTFGHTFLRIDSKPRPGSKKKHDLLDYGINYGAGAGDEGGPAYVLKGLAGGYPGFFSMQPYFEKVKEYNDSESRDIWEYRLNLSPKQIDRMLNHLWELGSTYFDYYFFDENCSYHLLSLLEIANPDWHLTDQFFYWVIPADTIKVVAKQPGAIKKVDFRPSLFKQLKQKVDHMSPDELEDFKRIRMEPNPTLTGKETDLVLESALDQQKFSMFRNKEHLSDAQKTGKRKLTIALAKTKRKKRNYPSLKPEIHPEDGHPSAKVGLYSGVKSSTNAEGYIGFQNRFSYHDLFDQDEGFLEFTRAVMWFWDFWYFPEKSSFALRKFQLTSFTALAPLTLLKRSYSWTLNASLETPEDVDCNECVALHLDGGIGWSGGQEKSHIYYTLLKGNFDFTDALRNKFRLGPSLLMGVVKDKVFGARIKFGLEAEGYYFPNQNSSDQLKLRSTAKLSWLFAKNLEARLHFSHFTRVQNTSKMDFSGMVSWYY